MYRVLKKKKKKGTGVKIIKSKHNYLYHSKYIILFIIYYNELYHLHG